MRYPRFGPALVALLLSLGPAAGQALPVRITSAQVGFPPGSPAEVDYVCKANAWAPVYFGFEALAAVGGDAALVLTTSDADDLETAVAVPLPAAKLAPGEHFSPMRLAPVPCVRLGKRDLTLTIREAVPAGRNPTAGRQLSEPFRLSFVRPRDTRSYIVLTLGSKPVGFELPEVKGADAARPKVHSAAIETVGLLPDRWYGYDAADLVVIPTGTSAEFLTQLCTNPQFRSRFDALAEWVRRGGRLVVSVGANAAAVAGLAPLQDLLPARIRPDAPSEPVKDLLLEWVLGAGDKTRLLNPLTGKGGTFPVANFVQHADRGYRQLVPPTRSTRENARQAVVQGPYGLGRVTLVGFDLDRPPVLDYDERPKLWDLIVRECGSDRAAQTFGKPAYAANGITEDELAADLRQYADTFPAVPVVSFGWVAVLIVLYTLLVGPVEYYFLKRVFGRLELTWLTFPLIVATVSVLAYLSARSLKGDELRVNKIDLVDVDPATGRVYGHAWFTAFSPRIATYRVGVEPAEAWGSPADVLVDWSGASAGSRGSFFRRSYAYHLGAPAGGLDDVPIQVWSTKAFAADWSAATGQPLAASNLYHPPAKPEAVAGTFTLNLPFKDELQDVYLIYAGKPYRWDPIFPGVPVNAYLDESRVELDWLKKLSALIATGSAPRGGAKASTGLAPMFDILFHDEAEKLNDTTPPRNATLRRLDQSWRLSSLHRDELIVVGRLPAGRDTSADEAAAPTKLSLPSGSLRQETYVRVYVPVRPFKKP